MLGTQVGVMYRGQLLQAGPRDQMFYRPQAVQTARLLDMRNLLPAVVVSSEKGQTTVRWADKILMARTERSHRVGETVWAGIRPEHVLVVRPSAPSRPNELSGLVTRMLYLSGQVHVTIRPHGAAQELNLEFSEHLLPRFGVEVGRESRVSLWHERLHLMPQDDEGA